MRAPLDGLLTVTAAPSGRSLSVLRTTVAQRAPHDGRLPGTLTTVDCVEALIAVGPLLSASKTQLRREAIQLFRLGLG